MQNYINHLMLNSWSNVCFSWNFISSMGSIPGLFQGNTELRGLWSCQRKTPGSVIASATAQLQGLNGISRSRTDCQVCSQSVKSLPIDLCVQNVGSLKTPSPISNSLKQNQHSKKNWNKPKEMEQELLLWWLLRGKVHEDVEDIYNCHIGITFMCCYLSVCKHK